MNEPRPLGASVSDVGKIESSVSQVDIGVRRRTKVRAQRWNIRNAVRLEGLPLTIRVGRHDGTQCHLLSDHDPTKIRNVRSGLKVIVRPGSTENVAIAVGEVATSRPGPPSRRAFEPRYDI